MGEVSSASLFVFAVNVGCCSQRCLKGQSSRVRASPYSFPIPIVQDWRLFYPVRRTWSTPGSSSRLKKKRRRKKKIRTKHIIREMTVSMNHIEVTLFTSNLLNLKAKQKDLLIFSTALDFLFLHYFLLL